MLPKDNYRVRTMSMAYFMESEDAPAVWRGPMTNSAFDRMAFGTAWGPLDVLVVDLPPGQWGAWVRPGPEGGGGAGREGRARGGTCWWWTCHQVKHLAVWCGQGRREELGQAGTPATACSVVAVQQT